MSSAPVVVQVLEGEGAVAKYREVMGATDPAKADAGTIRKDVALSIGENSVHGSDAAERSEEHTSELQSLMRISYAVFCLKKNKQITTKKRYQTFKRKVY